jgi:GTPase
MLQSEILPVVVIVGRPNVGKSTLFNAILRQRRAIVGDEPGITRDRIEGLATHRGCRFDLIDTGGIIPNEAELIPSEIFRQARFALEAAVHIVFVIDGRTEITSADRELAQLLHQLGKPVSLAVNKIDAPVREGLASEFYALGFEHLFAVSAEHRRGLDELLDRVTEGFAVSEENAAKPTHEVIKIAIIGRPNVGKSTLLNALVGGDRAIVSPIAGTTRDAVDESVFNQDTEFVFVDTAGIRRKGKTNLMAEKLSVVMAQRHIRMADVVLLVLDASEGIVGLDANIAGYAHEAGRALIIAVNKWDAVPEKGQRAFQQKVRDQMKFLEYAPITFLSAKEGTGVKRLLPMVKKAFESFTRRVTTGELNRFAASLRIEPDVRVFYITQPSIRPPSFLLFTDRKSKLHFSAERYVMNRIREQRDFRGTPLVVRARSRRG